MDRLETAKKYNRLQRLKKEMDIISMELEDCINCGRTYIYNGFNVFVSMVNLDENFVIINSCEDIIISDCGLEDFIVLDTIDFITTCL